MVNSSTFSLKKKLFYILSFIFLFLFTFFVFTKRSLDPAFSLYKDLHPQSTLLSSSFDSQPLDDGFSPSPFSVDPNSDTENVGDGDGDTENPSFDQESPVSSTSNPDDVGDTKNPSTNAEPPAPSTSSVNDVDDTQIEELVDKKAISDSESASVILGLEGLKSCNLYDGKWVKDEENYPVYKPGSCPYVDEAYDCQANGRKDTNYLQWRWKPNDCNLPRFNAIEFLKRLRGKRLMLVGDSVNRNQFESLLCLIHQGLPNKTKMYEIHGYKITKGRGYYIFKFEDYDCTVEFVRSHFLVKEGTRLGGSGNTNPTLSIDKIDKSASRWKKADILIFNTAHWWTHGKTARGKNYYKEGDHIYPHFDAVEAYRRALKTWAKWVDENISPTKLVFYRGYSSAHFRGGDWDSGGTCNGETEPILRGGFLDNYPLKMKIVDEVIRQMRVPVVALNVTKLTNFRKDGHPSVYGKNVTGMTKVSTRRQDCSHWCLPGVPDAWNELIYTTLLIRTVHSSSFSSLPSHF